MFTRQTKSVSKWRNMYEYYWRIQMQMPSSVYGWLVRRRYILSGMPSVLNENRYLSYVCLKIKPSFRNKSKIDSVMVSFVELSTFRSTTFFDKEVYQNVLCSYDMLTEGWFAKMFRNLLPMSWIVVVRTVLVFGGWLCRIWYFDFVFTSFSKYIVIFLKHNIRLYWIVCDYFNELSCFLEMFWFWNDFPLADVNECSMKNPCQNGGTCMNKDGGFKCKCPPYWTGPLCNQGIWSN